MLAIRTFSELKSLANNAKIKSSLYILIRYHFKYFVECLRAIRDNYQEKRKTQKNILVAKKYLLFKVIILSLTQIVENIEKSFVLMD